MLIQDCYLPIMEFDFFTISLPAAEEAIDIERIKTDYSKKLKNGFYANDAVRNNERFHFVCRTHVQYVKISITIYFWFFGDFRDFSDFL